MKIVETNEYKLTIELASGKVITSIVNADTKEIAVQDLEYDYASGYKVLNVELLGKINVMH